MVRVFRKHHASDLRVVTRSGEDEPAMVTKIHICPVRRSSTG